MKKGALRIAAIFTALLVGGATAWICLGFFSPSGLLGMWGAHLSLFWAIIIGIMAGSVALFQLWPWNRMTQ